MLQRFINVAIPSGRARVRLRRALTSACRPRPLRSRCRASWAWSPRRAAPPGRRRWWRPRRGAAETRSPAGRSAPPGRSRAHRPGAACAGGGTWGRQSGVQCWQWRTGTMLYCAKSGNHLYRMPQNKYYKILGQVLVQRSLSDSEFVVENLI